MSCKCKNIIENFQGGSIPLDTTFLGNIHVCGSVLGCSPVTIGNDSSCTSGNTTLVVSGSSIFGCDVDILGNIYSGGTNLMDIFSSNGTSGLFAQTADSIPVSAITSDVGSLIGDGVGEFKLPANSLQVGDTFHLKVSGLVKNIGISGLTFILAGATELLDTGIIGANSTPGTEIDREWELEIDFTIRSIGGSGNVQVVGEFNHAGYLIAGGAGVSANRYNFHQNSSIDTTIDNNLELKVEWPTAFNDSAIYTHLVYLNKVY